VIYPYGSLKFPTPFSDTSVDNISNEDGRIDQFFPIDLKISDKRLIENINQRIEDSKTYYDDPEGFNLSVKRSENLRMYLGIQVDGADFYEQEEPYIENQIRGAVESIVTYCTARSPIPEVTKGNSTPEATKFASNLRKALMQHSVDFDLKGLLAILVRNWLLNQESYMGLEFDPNYGDQGEIIPSILPSDEVIVDKNAKYNQNPAFIVRYEKGSVEELLFAYPNKRKEILDSQGIERVGRKNISTEIVYRKVYITYYTPDGPKEGMCVYFDDVMLEKTKDLNWLEGRRNFLKAPMKPVIPLNVLSDGKHYVDFSNFMEDGIKMQKLLNVRGRQVSLNADGSNGTKVINAKASGLTKEDAENLTPGPNKTIFLKRAKDGVALDQMVDIIPAHDLPEFVVNDKQDMRTQIGNLLAVPVDQTDVNDDPTLGQTLIKKNNLNARQDQIVRALDRFLHLYFNLLTQMMFVWYDEDHFFSYEDVDGEFESIVIKRYYFDDGMRAGVSGGSTIAFDKNREQAMAMKLSEKDKISNLDLYRILGFDNPQKLYDNWVKQMRDPMELAKDANDAVDNADAYAEMLEFANGKRPDKTDNVSQDYILTLRKLMIPMVSTGMVRGKKVKRTDITAFVGRFNEYLDEYELKESLDQLGQEDMQKIAPGQPIPPPMPAAPMMPPAPPMGPPGMPPPGPPGMPPGPMPLVPQPTPVGANPVFGGGPLPNPASPQVPSGLSAIPGI
jgi:hypothetical protein